MILAVLEQFHDYQPAYWIIDTDKLDKTNPVEKLVLEEIKKNKRVLRLNIDGDKLEVEDSGFNQSAVIGDNNKFVAPIDKVMYLNINFDC